MKKVSLLIVVGILVIVLTMAIITVAPYLAIIIVGGFIALCLYHTDGTDEQDEPDTEK